MNKFMIAFALTTVMALPATAHAAAACRDNKGHFVKCTAPAAAHAAARPSAHPAVAAHVAATTTRRVPCRDARGRFKKC